MNSIEPATQMKEDPISADDAVASQGGDTPVGQLHGRGHRLGPLIAIVPLDQPVIGRLYAAGLAVAAGAILWVAVGLAPSDRNMGTHRQLGLPPCGFIVMTGLPCPTCGMTTAYANVVRGRLIQAFRCQAAGSAMAIATIGVGLIAAVGTVTGRRPALNWYRVKPTHLLWWLTAFLIGSWTLTIVLGLLDGTLPVR